jgi:fused signal recognition particle receptor
MPRSWQELVRTGAGPSAAADRSGGHDGGEPDRAGFLSRLRTNMARTRQALAVELRATALGAFDDAAWERLEEALIAADVGPAATARIVSQLELEAGSGDLLGGERFSDRVVALLAEAASSEPALLDLSAQPAVVLVVGVNGTGKTTTIGKLAFHLRHELGSQVLIAAADTFRAAAVEQLERWAERAEADFVRAERGSDPGAVAFDAVEAARARDLDVVIVDTAGRLHTQLHLMDELRKVRKVLASRLDGAPHETLLTIDATTGQNGLRQAQLFREAVGVTGVALTKLDSSSRGGIAIAIASELQLPIKLAGTGEGIEDLQPFDPDAFARAIADPGA